MGTFVREEVLCNCERKYERKQLNDVFRFIGKEGKFETLGEAHGSLKKWNVNQNIEDDAQMMCVKTQTQHQLYEVKET